MSLRSRRSGGVAALVLLAGVGCVGVAGDAGGAADGGPDGGSADPLNASPRCTSGVTWTPADGNTRHMRPGEGCAASAACHGAGTTTLLFAVSGTVYQTGHEPDDCAGINVSASGADLVHVVIDDANGDETTMLPNETGNFYLTQLVAFPVHARLKDDTTGKERAMTAAIASGDCDGCHSQNGANGAPGRLTTPL